MYTYRKYRNSRFWAVYRDDGQLVCVTVYKVGAATVCAMLNS